MVGKTEEQQRGGDALSSVAAVALLATAALDAKRRAGDHDGGGPTVAEESMGPEADLAALGRQRGIKGRIDTFQAERPALAFPAGVIRKFSDDRGGRLAAVISYYGFFSIFPALLAMTTILGFLLESNPDLADSIRDSTLAQFPVVGSQLAGNSEPLTGNVLALVIGIGGAIWAGMGAAQASQDAMNTIWNVPRPDQPSFALKRLRSLAALVVMAVFFGANAVLPDLTGARTSGVVSVILLVVAAVVVDAAIFALAFRILTCRPLSFRQVWIGAVVAAAGYVFLQNIGTIFINHVVEGATDTYGTFATVIGLLTWMFLLGQWVILSATINVVRELRLWPRSMFRPPSTRADRRSQRGKIEEAKLTDGVEVDVAFSPDRPSP